jgi:sulfate transport system ATP-binding protein
MSVQVNNLRKTFGQYTALGDVSLSVKSGKLTALLGPSGSGKTTLLRIIAGLEYPDEGSGQILFHGENVTNVPAGQRKVGFVFQHYALFRHMTVFENIAFGLKVRKNRPPKAELTDRVHKLLKLVQLENLAERYPSSFPAASGSASRSRGPWRWSRRCCCSTSRSAPWTRRSAPSCASGCGVCTRRST